MKVAIPSFNRYNDLKTIHHLDGLDIYLFVVEEEYEEYRTIYGDKCKIIIGEKGLMNQRNFMSNYFEENEIICYMDDDISWFSRPVLEWLPDSIDYLRDSSFGLMTFPSTTMYMEGKYGFKDGYYFGIGAMYISKNHKELQLTYEQGEDFQRNILYLKKYGKNIRNRGVFFKTKYFGTGGLESYRTVEKYVTETNKLVLEYKDYLYFKDKQIMKHSLGNVNMYRKLKDISIVELGYYNCYAKLFTIFEQITFKIKKGATGRRGFPGYRGAVYGLTRPRFKYKGHLQLSHDSKCSPEAYEEIMRIGKIICPFEFNSVQVNKNLVCPPHKDSNNIGLSLLVSFGDYTGCNIIIENKKYDANCRPVIFNGAALEHYNSDDLVGTKYSLVFFTTLNR